MAVVIDELCFLGLDEGSRGWRKSLLHIFELDEIV